MSRARLLFAAGLALAALAFAALGLWQVERRAWKLDLIAAVNERARAAPVPAPPPAAWGQVTRARDAYRRVWVSGRYDHARAMRVAAVTGRGEGAWLLTPLAVPGGWSVFVNRGFVPAGARASAPAGPVTITGLLRLSEPGGDSLRRNDPAAGRWYSRDVAALAAAARLTRAAPYFIDADARSEPGPIPLGGLTVIRFHNWHLGYALTWFTLAGLSLLGLAFLLRSPPPRG